MWQETFRVRAVSSIKEDHLLPLLQREEETLLWPIISIKMKVKVKMKDLILISAEASDSLVDNRAVMRLSGYAFTQRTLYYIHVCCLLIKQH